MLVFISHPDQARAYALQTKQVFEEYDYETWLWEDDRPAKGDLDLVLHQAISESDYLVHICTGHTGASDGQAKERLFAKIHKKPLVLLVFRPGFWFLSNTRFVPNDVDPRAMYNYVSHNTFNEDCRTVVERLLRHEPEKVSEVEDIDLRVKETARVTESIQVVLKRG